MMCLDIKLVSRLRGVSSTSSATNVSATTPSSATSTSSTTAFLEKCKRGKGRRESTGDASSVTESDSEEETLPIGPEMIRRNRSRSVCVSALSSMHQGHLRRRASHHVSTNDTISRRGVLSRRYYGSVEMLPQIEQDGYDNGRRFRVENGDSPGEKEEMFGSPSTPILENPEYQTRWYFKYFLGKLHQNYIAADPERNCLFLSVVTNEVSDQSVPHYRVILWTKSGAQKISLPYSANKTITIRQILSNFFGLDKLDKAPREVFAPEIQKDLLLLEEQEGSVNFKFGIIYAKKGQTTDDEMLSNEKGSPDFDKFLEILGERIRLKNWDKYRGGLDVKGDMTGKESYYTVYAGHEVMYHVSTMLPYSKDNPQQLERKRHIGNDIVNIIYTDDPNAIDTFNPNCIRSQFTHVFAVVSTEDNGKGWRVAIFCDESVPLFGPSLPCPPVFEDPYTLREFLLVKLINGEKATFNTPTFAQKRERTLDALLRDMYQEHSQDSKSNSMLNRRALSDVVEAPGRRREETRAVEMVQVGQALKLEAIVRGLAPTSLATAGPLKPRPWEPRCIYPDFPHEIVCGDVWLDNRLILASENGTFLLEDSISHRLIFDESVQIKQLDVVEQHGILLFRTGDKGKESNVYVFRLKEFENNTGNRSAEVPNDREEDQDGEDNGEDEDAEDDGDESEDNDCDNFTRATAKFKPVIRRTRARVRPLAVRGRTHIKERKLPRTRGCNLYSITMPGGSHLRMCVVVGRRLTVLQWKHSAAWTAWCSAADTDTIDGFLFVKEFNVNETPSLVTIMENTNNEWTLCCGVRHHFELISSSGSTRVLHIEGTPKPHLVAALNLCEDEEPELLLCYNNTCHFQKIWEESTTPTEFDFNWNSVPAAIACAFPYIIAFTNDTMEIRLIINGNLVHTIAMPNLNLFTSKQDIFFSTTAPEFLPGKCERIRLDTKPADKEEPVSSPSPFTQSSSSSRTNLQNNHGEWKPIRIYQIPLQTLSRSTLSNCSQRRCPSPAEPEVVSAPPTSDKSFLSVEPHRALSRSCSSSPTPTPTNLIPPRIRK
ncbi:GTPase-activating Rap/Ran-GAP domain-like protein 3 isoform X1 [Osmia lignaria lignaria]|uniref:GTPase-activating Rap/Ran-GAP domain-like protein 3 isoform X1 n=2 Tax=Osmia lignaria lignaria TaxID=1437193 RepID=UPI0014790D14|nr:GTPase-activating Rap/Ran-GAP domain-like protein 3 isoform X1 [Osmia lignaria]XP_034188039.1 GTPase-activating Rap/Ran-GAP domain-like protein 3 isoform X1 [Osmia lignaria]XP_034188048.1 GTPase-activating Rap/Ran-GAP domain-like protein 3 isoform X1 [Osmia lignaria]XP_034188055.1 GTPase-activating Rap/Ran-GAP domain-like protein 3 isoform X1 [Osmia lignaria]XP_034188063.1 GTPase-activating Rap/Ran-GAP domain-like protein 3 isoform X1 [Osmia lignaria]XP_034188073.1 GTPase-activating Rap/Ran